MAGLCLVMLLASPVNAQQLDPHETAMFDEVLYGRIEDHLTGILGDIPNVWHELVSPDIHVDLLPFPPNEDRDFWVISTAGMSYRKMTIPDHVEDADFWSRAELMVALPADWFPSDDLDADIKDEAVYFPIRRLKQLARYPHYAATSLTASHTFSFQDPLGPGTDMNSFVIWWPTFLREGDDVLEYGDGENVNFYAIIPIYEAERQFAVDNGTDALLEKLGRAGVTSLFDPTRPSVVGGGG